jgi:hypothetical protein
MVLSPDDGYALCTLPFLPNSILRYVSLVNTNQVWLDDLDLNMHMNNSCYYKHADLGLYELALR